MRPHHAVHRRRDGERRLGGQAEGAQQIVGAALGQARERVRAGRSDQHPGGPACEFDVAHRGFGRLVPERAAHRVARQRLEGGRTDEVQGRRGHHHPHLGAGVLQPAHQLGRLVGRDAAGDAQQDALTLEFRHRCFPYVIARR